MCQCLALIPCHLDAVQIDQLMLIKPQLTSSQLVVDVPLHAVDDGGSADDARVEALNKLLAKGAISITKGQVRPGAGLCPRAGRSIAARCCAYSC